MLRQRSSTSEESTSAGRLLPAGAAYLLSKKESSCWYTVPSEDNATSGSLFSDGCGCGSGSGSAPLEMNAAMAASAVPGSDIRCAGSSSAALLRRVRCELYGRLAAIGTRRWCSAVLHAMVAVNSYIWWWWEEGGVQTSESPRLSVTAPRSPPVRARGQQ